MGTNYYLMHTGETGPAGSNGELFELGRGPWSALITRRLPYEKYIEQGYEITPLDVDGSGSAIARAKLDIIWNWCECRDWKVILISDAEPLYAAMEDIEVSGSCLIEGPAPPRVTLKRLIELVQDLRVDWLADKLEVYMTIQHVDEERGDVHYHVSIGDDGVDQGYTCREIDLQD